MPVVFAALVSFLSSAFTWLIVTFGKFFTKRAAIRLAILTVYGGLITAFMTAIAAITVGLSYVLPSEITMVAGWIVPSNAMQCISAYYAALAARWVYDARLEAIRISSYIT